jgi:hypothetical protein
MIIFSRESLFQSHYQKTKIIGAEWVKHSPRVKFKHQVGDCHTQGGYNRTFPNAIPLEKNRSYMKKFFAFF